MQKCTGVSEYRSCLTMQMTSTSVEVAPQMANAPASKPPQGIMIQLN